MIVKNTNGESLRLTKNKLFQILPKETFGNTYSYVFLKDLEDSLTNIHSNVDLYPLNMAWDKDLPWFFAAANLTGSKSSVNPAYFIGCCVFSKKEAEKIIKAVKAELKGAKKKKK